MTSGLTIKLARARRPSLRRLLWLEPVRTVSELSKSVDHYDLERDSVDY